MLITIISFGFKYSQPYNLDLLFDVRFLPNPHFVEELRPKTGMDAEIVDYLQKQPEYEEFYRRLERDKPPISSASDASTIDRARSTRKTGRCGFPPTSSGLGPTPWKHVGRPAGVARSRWRSPRDASTATSPAKP